MSNPLESILTITSAQTNIQDGLKSDNPVEILNSLAQLASGIASYLAKYSPVGSINTNLGAALLLTQTMELNYRQSGAWVLESLGSLTDLVVLRLISMIVTPFRKDSFVPH